MNSKILIAFISGAALASGIVFLAVKEEMESKPRAEVIAASKPAVGQPAAAADRAESSAPAKPVEIKPAPVRVDQAPARRSASRPPILRSPVKETLSRVPIREKPSPLVPRAKRDESNVVAANQSPAPPAPETQADAPVAADKPSGSQASGSPAYVEAQIPTPSPAPAPAAPSEQAPAPAEPPAAQPQVNTAPSVTIQVGTILPVRIGETISAAHYQKGDTFLATLDRQLVVDGWIIAERGSRVEGRIVQSTHGNDGSRLEIELVKLSTSDGQRVPIRTQSYKKETSGVAGNDVAKVAAGAVIGTAIGAMAGGGKGAAIGAGVGTVAGAAGAAATHGRGVDIPVETRVSFRIMDPVTITERLN